jgi:SNF2 family DNA or RNA helicase
MRLFFALGLKIDAITGVTPVPYLLNFMEDNGFCVIYQRLEYKIYNSDIELLKKNGWIEEVVKLTDLLKYDEINKKVNKNYHKQTLEEYYNSLEPRVKKILSHYIDGIKSKILDLIVNYNITLFFAEAKNNRNVYKESFISVEKEKLQVKFFFEKSLESLVYRLSVLREGLEIDLKKPGTMIFSESTPSIIYDKKLYLFEDNEFNAVKIKPFLKLNEIIVEHRLEGEFFKKFIKPVARKFEYSVKGFELKELKPDITPLLRVESAVTGSIILTPAFRYGDMEVIFYNRQNVFIDVKEKSGRYYLESITRNLDYEAKILKFYEDIGFHRRDKYFYLFEKLTDKYKFVELFAEFVPSLNKIGVVIENHLFDKKVVYLKPVISYDTSEKTDWFDLNIIISVGKNKIRFVDLRNNIFHKNPEYVFPDGTVFIIPSSWFTELYPFALRTSDDNMTTVKKVHLALLEDNKLIPPDKKLLHALNKLELKRELKLPVSIKAKLRDYQKEGFYRIYNFTQSGYGICLADDMGLGKTLQVITVLQKYFETKSLRSVRSEKSGVQLSLFDFDNDIVSEDKVAKPALIVVPKSLVFNWIEELEKFAPALKYFVYHSKDRYERIKTAIGNVNLIITTYGVVRQDVEFLKDIEFSYLVIDESQAIKNPDSKTYKSMTTLNSIYKISITGTPVENNLTELWTQMTFLNRNILGSLRYFEDYYINPILRERDAGREFELKRIIAPFILRRRKKDVAKELPEKTEQIIYCPMTEEQNNIYENEKSLARNKLLLIKENKKNVIQILSVLNRLRQIAIHPVMLDEYDEVDCGKFNTVLEVVNNLLQEGHKFLMFSSFVKHLRLFKEHFKEKGIRFLMLTGRDTNRKDIVNEYQNNDAIKPLLISIKAGGTGLNLTAASYVLLLDPWWNPAVERQAVDRTHRIGQSANVTIYKFITKDTVEEKMLHLQKQKLHLVDSFIEENVAQGLNYKDIENIL